MSGRIGALAAAAVTAGCGAVLMWNPSAGVDGSAPASARGATGFTRVSLSTCSDWRSARLSERQRLIADIGDHFGHDSRIWDGATLDGRAARRLFEDTCAERYARNIKLYKIYARGLSFSSLR